MKYDPKYERDLEKILLKTAKDKKLFHSFLIDLLTPTEYNELALRWQIVKMLEAKIPHHTIAKRLHTSVATVTRGSREMRNKIGGFQKALKLK